MSTSARFRLVRCSMLSLLVLGGCSGSADEPGPAPFAPPPPSIQAVSPSTIYRGRAARFDVGTIGTAFIDAPRVTLLGGKITVDHVDVLSTTALRIEAFVPGTVGESRADVAIDGLTLSSGLILADPIELASKPVQVKQGLWATHTLLNRDSAHPFREGEVTLDLGAGIIASPTVVTATELTFTMQVAPDAAPGERDLKVTLTSELGAPVERAMSTTIAKVVKIDTLAVSELPEGTTATVDVPKGVQGAYLRAKGGAGRLLSLRCPSAIDDKGAKLRPFLALFEGASSARPGASIAGDELLIPAPAAADPLVFVGPFDWTIAGGTKLTVVSQSWSAGGGAEVEPNETTTVATALSQPFVARGALADLDDVDVYAVALPAGTVVVRTLPIAGEVIAPDTSVELLDATGKVFAYNEDEDAASNDPLSFVRAAVPAATNVFIRVRAGHSALGGGEYLLAVVTR